MKKGQGSLEYLIMLAAVLAIAAIVVFTLTKTGAGARASASIAACKQAASQCATELFSNPSATCDFCEDACIDPMTGGEVASNALKACKEGKPYLVGVNEIETVVLDVDVTKDECIPGRTFTNLTCSCSVAVTDQKGTPLVADNILLILRAYADGEQMDPPSASKVCNSAGRCILSATFSKPGPSTIIDCMCNASASVNGQTVENTSTYTGPC